MFELWLCVADMQCGKRAPTKAGGSTSVPRRNVTVSANSSNGWTRSPAVVQGVEVATATEIVASAAQRPLIAALQQAALAASQGCCLLQDVVKNGLMMTAVAVVAVVAEIQVEVQVPPSANHPRAAYVGSQVSE